MLIKNLESYIHDTPLPFSTPPGFRMENENYYNLAKYKNFLRKFYDTITIIFDNRKEPILYIQL